MSIFVATTRAEKRIAKALSEVLGKTVLPADVIVTSAKGYWAHSHQDCQRWTGHARGDAYGMYSIGSWNLTLADLRKGRAFEVTDCRTFHAPDNQFQFEPRDTP